MDEVFLEDWIKRKDLERDKAHSYMFHRLAKHWDYFEWSQRKGLEWMGRGYTWKNLKSQQQLKKKILMP